VNAARSLYALTFVTLIGLAGCGTPPGQPRKGSETVAPNQVMEFDALYRQNCAACHGADGRGGAAIAMANPVYLAIAGDEVIRSVIATGVSGTSMPAFAQHAGGMLTDQQIDVITTGMRTRWSRPGTLDGAHPPSYAATVPGNAQQGEGVYRKYCNSCHGSNGAGGPKGSAITNDSFLALVSDQGLRTVIISGRPELGAPDWRGYAPDGPMSDQDVTDVVAWLASRRVQSPGQPYSASTYPQ
jgi:cytochrome c oxidase cbb3-type subunit III